MRRVLNRAMLPTLGAALFAGAVFTAAPKQAEASRYAVAWGVVADCGNVPASPCPGEPK